MIDLSQRIYKLYSLHSVCICTVYLLYILCAKGEHSPILDYSGSRSETEAFIITAGGGFWFRFVVEEREGFISVNIDFPSLNIALTKR